MNSHDIETTKLPFLKGKQIRRVIFNNEWWFSITDVIEALIGTDRPRKYWNDLKKKLIAEGYRQVSENRTTGNYKPVIVKISDRLRRYGNNVPYRSVNKTVARRGGSVAGKARKETEKEIGRSVISKGNYLKKPESQKRLRTRK